MIGLQYCTRGRAARAGVDHTAGGMAEAPAHTEELLHGTSKGSLGDLELAFDRFRDVLHERLAIKHKLGMLFCATLA